MKLPKQQREEIKETITRQVIFDNDYKCDVCHVLPLLKTCDSLESELKNLQSATFEFLDITRKMDGYDGYSRAVPDGFAQAYARLKAAVNGEEL